MTLYKHRKAPVTITAADALTDAEHEGTLLNVSAAAGVALTLPAATGTGNEYILRIATTITSNSTTIKAASADDSFTGNALLAQDSANTAVHFEAAAGDDTVTLNGSTTGGIAGDMIRFIDAASGIWQVNMVGSATGTEATPFSATVS